MCGIVYAHDFEGRAVNNGVLNQFDSQRSRGTQGFGLFDGSQLNIVKSASEDKILKWMVKYESNLLLFHHRFPTSTDNTKRTAHPFTTGKFFGDNQYILVHNGHISNCYMLKNEHEKLDIAYKGVAGIKFNDSEALLWDFALYMEGKQDKIKAYGGMAFVCIKLVKGKLDKLYFGRNTNPLNMLKVKQGIMLASEGPGTAIEADTLYTWNYQAKRLTNRKVIFPSWNTASYKPTAVVPYRNPEPNWNGHYNEDDELAGEAAALNYDEDFDTHEVENKCLRYLIAANGYYETAYDAMDLESIQLDELTDNKSIREKELLWAAMSMMEQDVDWENQDSICNLFREAKEAKNASTLQLPLKV